MTARASHIPALDGLRGVAILLVLLHHFTFYGGLRPGVLVDKVFYLTMMAGWCGVDLFFVLSGFLITGILIDTKGTTGFFRNFYVRRCLRIFPLYFGVLVVVFVVLPPLAAGVAPASYGDAVSEQAWYWAYLVNVRIAVDGWPRFNLLAHFWSLAVEEQFYLIWPLLVFWTTRKGLLTTCVACVVVALAVRIALMTEGEYLAAYVLTPARMDALAIGGMLAVLAREEGGLWRWRGWAVAALVGAGCALVAMFVLNRGLWTEHASTVTLGYSLLAVFFGAFLTLAVTAETGNVVHRVLCCRSLRTLGQYSYGLYVFHHPIVIVLRSFFTAPDVPTLYGSQLPGLAAYTVIGAVASLAAAMLSWHLYESPFLRLKQRFASTATIPVRAAVSQV